jgi:hypothetical protein
MASYRLEIHHNGKSLAFGNYHACGEYLMIWDTTEYAEPDVDNVIVDEDQFTGFAREKMLSLIQEHGFTVKELEQAKSQWLAQQMGATS